MNIYDFLAEAARWTAVAAAALALVLGPTRCVMHRDDLIAKTIKDGADPLAARCALEGEGDRESTCRNLALTKAR